MSSVCSQCFRKNPTVSRVVKGFSCLTPCVAYGSDICSGKDSTIFTQSGILGTSAQTFFTKCSVKALNERFFIFPVLF